MNQPRRAANSSVIPGLTDDVAELCISRVPRSSVRILSVVCRRWRSFVESGRLAEVRKSAGVVEDFLCVVMDNWRSGEVYWEVFDTSGNKLGQIPPIPGPVNLGVGVTVLGGGKIVFIGGVDVLGSYDSADVYEFDPGVNRWRKQANLNVPRHDFTCAEVNGLLYVIGGRSRDTVGLSNAEVYNPETNVWSLIECPNRPDERSFAFSFNSKLYVMGNRSRFIDVYDPKTQMWHELNAERSLLASSYTVLGNKVYFMNRSTCNRCMPYFLAVFDPADNSWSSVFVPCGKFTGWEKLGVWNDKVLLFSGPPGFKTFIYDPYKRNASKWKMCNQIKPWGPNVGSVVIRF